MNKYIKPEMKIEKFDVSDIITVSGYEANVLNTWGTQVKKVNANEVTDLLQ